MRRGVVRAWPGASLVDLGDGALLLEFTSKANALGMDAFAAVHTARHGNGAGRVRGVVIGNQGRWFSAGADLGALLADAEAGNHSAVEAMISGFQRMATSLRAAPFPVVAAPFGMTAGRRLRNHALQRRRAGGRGTGHRSGGTEGGADAVGGRHHGNAWRARTPV